MRVDGTTTDNDFVGFVFSFQDTHNFYVVYASKQNSNQGPWKIVRVKSTDLTKLESGEYQPNMWLMGCPNP